MKKQYFTPETRQREIALDQVLANASLLPGSGSESFNDDGEFDWGDNK